VREIIRKVSSEGTTIILASHLLDEVQKVCTHFAVLNKGKKVYAGSVEEASGDTEKVEVAAPDMDNLEGIVKTCPFVNEVEKNNQYLIVNLGRERQLRTKPVLSSAGNRCFQADYRQKEP
jgi:ABC-2 type transport system ATP-binding protein